MWPFKKLCRHEFDYLKQMKQTGFYDDEKGLSCPYFKKRVMCPCRKCHEIIFAHCGIELDGKLIHTGFDFGD